MTRLRLLTTGAAVLAISAGAAYAQTTDLPPERAPAAQQLAPPSRIAPPMDAGSGSDAHLNPAKPSTTGQGATGARPALTADQRDKIAAAIKREKAEPVTLDIALGIGTRVPDNIHYNQLPAEVVTIHPQWRGFDYIIVGTSIVVVDPAKREIVAVLGV